MSDVPPPPPPPSAMPPPPSPQLMAPPGYVGYVASPFGAAPLQRVTKLARVITILVPVAAVASLGSILATRSLRGDARDYLDGRMSADDFAISSLRVTGAQIVISLATLAAGILTMIWMHRIATNHRALQRTGTWSPGWAYGGWFVPPFLYVIPLLMLRELWRLSAPPSAAPDGASTGGENASLWAWFLLYGVGGTVVFIGSAFDTFSSMFSLDDPQGAQAEVILGSQTWTYVGFGLGLVAAAAFVVFVRQLTDRHVRLTGETTRPA